MSATVFYNSAAELATCSNVFAVSGTPTDPTAVTLVITDPAGVVVTYNWPGGPNTLTRVSAGSFRQDVPCNATIDGIWTGVWTGTGTASDVQPFSWPVQPLTLNRYYCTSDEVKSRLRISGTADDSEVVLAVSAASRAVDRYCDRYFYRITDTRTYIPTNLYETRIDDFVSITTLATDPAGTAAQGGNFPVVWPAAAYQPLPYNPGTVSGEPGPYRKIRAVGGLTFPWVVPMLLMRMDRVQVTGVFGWPSVPQAVRTATLITASELFRAKDMPGGGQVPGEFAFAAIAANPLVGQLLEDYVVRPFLAA
jgi:hypothetical protein